MPGYHTIYAQEASQRAGYYTSAHTKAGHERAAAFHANQADVAGLYGDEAAVKLHGEAESAHMAAAEAVEFLEEVTLE